eukprot:COSAG06_NODE_181_length_20926_cov_7.590051_13_plen_68_part_00
MHTGTRQQIAYIVEPFILSSCATQRQPTISQVSIQMEISNLLQMRNRKANRAGSAHIKPHKVAREPQ